jgi:hypothetical protein
MLLHALQRLHVVIQLYSVTAPACVITSISITRSMTCSLDRLYAPLHATLIHYMLYCMSMHDALIHYMLSQVSVKLQLTQHACSNRLRCAVCAYAVSAIVANTVSSRSSIGFTLMNNVPSHGDQCEVLASGGGLGVQHEVRAQLKLSSAD